jgi:hypothetical protein
MEDLARERPELDLVRSDLAGQRHAEHGPTMEAATEGDQPERPVAARAILTAFSTASAPVLTRNDFFGVLPGAAALSRSQSSTYDS